jgi:dolichol kinase
LGKEEILRKLLHLFALGVPFGILYLPRKLAIVLMLSITIGSLAFEILRTRITFVNKLFTGIFGSFLRAEESARFTGATFLFISGSICLIFFEKNVAFIALSFMILGDAAAALIGMNFGKIRIGKKSLEGSLACAVTCIVFWFFFPAGMSFVKCVAIAVSTAILELLPLKINDNLFVPIVTGTILELWMSSL